MITRIEITGYRCFRELGIDLGPYQVLAGANGAGKTTLLDAPVLLGDLLRQRQAADAFLQIQDDRRAPRAGTLTELLHQGEGDGFGFGFEARLPTEVTAALAERTLASSTSRVPTHLRYELRLEVTAYRLDVVKERLSLFVEDEEGNRSEPQEVLIREGKGATKFIPESTEDATEIPPLRVPSVQLALGAVPADPVLFPAALWFAQFLSDGVVYFAPDWEQLTRPARPGDPMRVLPSGRNLPWLALDLSRRDPDRFASWVDHVRTALPQITAIRMREREEDRYAYFIVEYAGGFTVTSSGLSTGTLCILAYTLLPYLDDAALPELLIVEEPENGIHPRAIETVVQSLSSLYDSQVWISTHSPIVLAHTELRDVLAARLNGDGQVTVVRGTEHPRLRDWRGSIDIGTLFAAGVLS